MSRSHRMSRRRTVHISRTERACGRLWRIPGTPGISVSSATNASHEGTGLVGGDVLFETGGLGLGVAVDKTVSGNFGQPWAGLVLAGFIVPVAIVRLEVLGELGRRASRFGDIFDSPGQTFVGVRPGVRFRFEPTPFNIGAGAIIRWPTSHGDFGSPDYGLVGRVGFEFP